MTYISQSVTTLLQQPFAPACRRFGGEEYGGLLLEQPGMVENEVEQKGGEYAGEKAQQKLKGHGNAALTGNAHLKDEAVGDEHEHPEHRHLRNAEFRQLRREGNEHHEAGIHAHEDAGYPRKAHFRRQAHKVHDRAEGHGEVGDESAFLQNLDDDDNGNEKAENAEGHLVPVLPALDDVLPECVHLHLAAVRKKALRRERFRGSSAGAGGKGPRKAA